MSELSFPIYIKEQTQNMHNGEKIQGFILVPHMFNFYAEGIMRNTPAGYTGCVKDMMILCLLLILWKNCKGYSAESMELLSKVSFIQMPVKQRL